MILVDHNEKSQAVDGVEEAEVMEIIDHHRLGSIQTMGPVFSVISRWDALRRSSVRCMKKTELK